MKLSCVSEIDRFVLFWRDGLRKAQCERRSARGLQLQLRVGSSRDQIRFHIAALPSKINCPPHDMDEPEYGSDETTTNQGELGDESPPSFMVVTSF